MLNGPDSNLFCHDAGSIRGRSIFFFVLFLYFSQKPGYLFKKELHIEWKSSGQQIYLQVFFKKFLFYSLESGIDRYFSWNCEVRFWRANQ